MNIGFEFNFRSIFYVLFYKCSSKIFLKFPFFCFIRKTCIPRQWIIDKSFYIFTHLLHVAYCLIAQRFIWWHSPLVSVENKVSSLKLDSDCRDTDISCLDVSTTTQILNTEKYIHKVFLCTAGPRQSMTAYYYCNVIGCRISLRSNYPVKCKPEINIPQCTIHTGKQVSTPLVLFRLTI